MGHMDPGCFSDCELYRIRQTAQNNRGVLIIIGGGSKPAKAIARIRPAMCDGGQILVVTSASGVPEESGPETVDLLKNTGATNVKWLHIAGKDTANADSTVSAIQQSPWSLSLPAAIRFVLCGESAVRKLKRLSLNFTSKREGLLPGPAPEQLCRVR